MNSRTTWLRFHDRCRQSRPIGGEFWLIGHTQSQMSFFDNGPQHPTSRFFRLPVAFCSATQFLQIYRSLLALYYVLSSGILNQTNSHRDSSPTYRCPPCILRQIWMCGRIICTPCLYVCRHTMHRSSNTTSGAIYHHCDIRPVFATGAVNLKFTLWDIAHSTALDTYS